MVGINQLRWSLAKPRVSTSSLCTRLSLCEWSASHESDDFPRRQLSIFLARRAPNARSRAMSEGEAKFWLEPSIALAHNYGLSDLQVRTAQQLVEGRCR
jgi:hypothetical protein